MRVGFDVSALTRPHSRGVTAVVRGLVSALERRAELEVVRLAPVDGADLRRWRQRELPRAVAREKLLGLHSFTSAFAWRGPGARVQTVHELPWRHGVRENADLGHRLWASLGSFRATRVVVPSAHVAADLARSALVSSAKVRVIHWGVDERFRPEPPPGVIDEAVLGRYRLGEEPFVLCLGATRAKKNLAAVIAGLAERKARNLRPLRLLVTGADTPALRSALGRASQLGLARWMATLDEVAEEDVPGLYRLASAALVLSHSEGFALPVLEALASGTPVLVPRASAQAEVAGEAGIAVDPADAGAVAEGLERALEQRFELAERGLERARAFSWDAAAVKVVALWRELA